MSRAERVAARGVDHGRRRLLVGGLTAGGGFLLGIPAIAWAADTAPAMKPEGGVIGFFVEIRADNRVVIGVAQPEIGQGVRTSMPMLVAEELDVEWSSVSIRQMPLGIVKTADGYTWQYGGQGAGGSTSVVDNWGFLREVGATARQMLIQAAAARWNVAPAQCRTEPGRVICDALGLVADYAAVAADAARLPIPGDESAERPALKDPADFRIIGKATRALDARAIVTGAARYGIDTALPGMRYAVIRRSPWLDGTVDSYDDSAGRQVRLSTSSVRSGFIGVMPSRNGNLSQISLPSTSAARWAGMHSRMLSMRSPCGVKCAGAAIWNIPAVPCRRPMHQSFRTVAVQFCHLLAEIQVAGDLPEAREWFEKAGRLFEVIEDRTSPIFVQRGLGDIAQMTGDYPDAKKHFQQRNPTGLNSLFQILNPILFIPAL